MTKIFFFIGLLFSMSFTAFSQSHSWGIQSGIVWSKVSKSSKEGISYRNGYTTGLSYVYTTKKKILLGADLLYIQKGWLEHPYDIHWDFRFNYLSIPIKIGIGDRANRLYFAGNVGLAPAWLLVAKIADTSLADITFTDEQGREIPTKIPKFDLSALVEVQAGYYVTETFRLGLLLNYQHSIPSLFDEHFFPEDKGYFDCISLNLKATWALK